MEVLYRSLFLPAVCYVLSQATLLKSQFSMFQMLSSKEEAENLGPVAGAEPPKPQQVPQPPSGKPLKPALKQPKPALKK